MLKKRNQSISDIDSDSDDEINITDSQENTLKKICTEKAKARIQNEPEKSIENSEEEGEDSSEENSSNESENSRNQDNILQQQNPIQQQNYEEISEKIQQLINDESLKVDKAQLQERHRKFLIKSEQDKLKANEDIFNQLLQEGLFPADGGKKKSSNSQNNKENILNQDNLLMFEDSESDSDGGLTEQDLKNNKKQIKEIEQFLKERNAQILKYPNAEQVKLSDYSLFTLQCSKNHIWDSSMKILNQYWCPRCIEPYAKIKQYVKKLGGRLISKCLMDVMEFECVKKHRFELELKNYYENWCTACYDDILDSLKMPSDNEYFQHIKESSQRQAQDFIKKYPNNFNFQNDMEKIQTVIYINDIPERLFLSYLQSLDKEELKKQKSRIQKNIHPDVNRHPYARNAFTKFTSLFQSL